MTGQKYSILFYGLLSLNVGYLAYKTIFFGPSGDDLDVVSLEIPQELLLNDEEYAAIANVAAVEPIHYDSDWATTRHAVPTDPHYRAQLARQRNEINPIYARYMCRRLELQATPREFVVEQKKCRRKALRAINRALARENAQLTRILNILRQVDPRQNR